jgi:hypothetical protein
MDLHRLNCEFIQIIDDNIGQGPLAQGAAVLETAAEGGLGTQAPMGSFEAHYVGFWALCCVKSLRAISAPQKPSD